MLVADRMPFLLRPERHTLEQRGLLKAHGGELRRMLGQVAHRTAERLGPGGVSLRLTIRPPTVAKFSKPTALGTLPLLVVPQMVRGGPPPLRTTQVRQVQQETVDQAHSRLHLHGHRKIQTLLLLMRPRQHLPRKRHMLQRQPRLLKIAGQIVMTRHRHPPHPILRHTKQPLHPQLTAGSQSRNAKRLFVRVIENELEM
jgi:hypothetical protein